MKKLAIGIFSFLTVLIISCSDDEKNSTVPVVSTINISSITNNSAISGGVITSDGGDNITARGVIWSTSQNPTITLNTKTIDGTGAGSFTSSITGLSSNTTYYVRAYATNSVGTSYGNEIVFTTLIDITTGLIAYYPFNGNADDASGNNNHGTVFGATLVADKDGNQNSAYSFNGINNYIRTNDSSSLSLNGDFSISLWFYDIPDSQLYHTFLGKRSGGNWSYNLATSINTNGVPSELNKIFTGRRYNNGAQQEYRFSNTTFNFNIWQHVVLTVQNNTITFYKNGVNMGTNSNGNQFTLPMINQNVGLTIGNNGSTTGTGEWMNGKLDEIRIYNRVLNTAEINYLFQN
jgi:hypothetical protein